MLDNKPTFGECRESSHCQYAEGQLFPDPHGNTTFCFSTQNLYRREIGELFPHR